MKITEEWRGERERTREESLRIIRTREKSLPTISEPNDTKREK